MPLDDKTARISSMGKKSDFSLNKELKDAIGEKVAKSPGFRFTVTFYRYSYMTFKFDVEGLPNLKLKTMHEAVGKRLDELDIFVVKEDNVFGVRGYHGFRLILLDQDQWSGDLHYFNASDAAEITSQYQLEVKARLYKYVTIVFGVLFCISVFINLYNIAK